MRQGRALFAGVIVLVLALAGCGGSKTDGNSGTGGETGDPPVQAPSAAEAARRAQSVDLPPLPDDPNPTATFLQGEGRVLVDFHRISEPLARVPIEEAEAQGTCRTVAAALDSGVPAPTDLLARAPETPDRLLGEMFSNDITAKGALLRSCDGGPSSAGAAADAAATHTIVARRLAEYGIR
jgi:hypothetical protein